jgi:hypothetical protein
MLPVLFQMDKPYKNRHSKYKYLKNLTSKEEFQTKGKDQLKQAGTMYLECSDGSCKRGK